MEKIPEYLLLPPQSLVNLNYQRLTQDFEVYPLLSQNQQKTPFKQAIPYIRHLYMDFFSSVINPPKKVAKHVRYTLRVKSRLLGDL